MGEEFGVAHAVTIGLEVVETPAGMFARGGMAEDCHQQSAEAPGVKFLMSPFGPGRGPRGGGAIKSFGEVAGFRIIRNYEAGLSELLRKGRCDGQR